MADAAVAGSRYQHDPAGLVERALVVLVLDSAALALLVEAAPHRLQQQVFNLIIPVVKLFSWRDVDVPDLPLIGPQIHEGVVVRIRIAEVPNETQLAIGRDGVHATIERVGEWRAQHLEVCRIEDSDHAGRTTRPQVGAAGGNDAAAISGEHELCWFATILTLDGLARFNSNTSLRIEEHEVAS